MRICRIVKFMPTASAHPGGLHAYFFTRYITEPTLIVTKRERAAWLPLPPHARVAPIAYRDVPLMNMAGNDGRRGWRRAALVAARSLLKLREVIFVAKALPPLVRFRPDVVHVHGLLTLVPGLLAQAWLGARLVLTIHSATDVALVRRLAVLRMLVGRADRVLCVAPALRDGLRGLLPEDRVDVLPSAFDPATFRDEGRYREERLIAVGQLKWQKGYGDLLAAMTEIVRRRPACRLVIAGDGPERARLEQDIERRGLRRSVELLGGVAQTDVARLLNESRLFVMASVSEGLPKAILEALACGTPIVVTDACNVSEIAAQAGAVVPAGRPDALADAVVALLEDEARWQDAARAAKEIARAYDWRTVAARVAGVYHELMAAA